jgi:hypothetical protein
MEQQIPKDFEKKLHISENKDIVDSVFKVMPISSLKVVKDGLSTLNLLIRRQKKEKKRLWPSFISIP